MKNPWDTTALCTYSMGNTPLVNETVTLKIIKAIESVRGKRGWVVAVGVGGYKLNCDPVCQVAPWSNG